VTRLASIELFGVPGSGKTSLFRRLLADATRDQAAPLFDGWAATSKVRALDLVRDAPWDVATTITRGLLAAPGPTCTPAGLEVASSCVRQRLAVQRSPATCLFHEGAANAAWRAQFRSERPLPVPYLAAMLPASDAVVAIEIDATTARARIRSKPQRGPLNDRLAEAPPDGCVWELAMACYASVREALRRSGRLYVLGGQPSLDEAVVRVRRLLETPASS
jgi:hypothetical protein